MSLIKNTHRFSPWSDLDVLADRMNRIFGDSGRGNLTCGANCVPPVSVEERAGEILLTRRREDRLREEGEADGRFHLVRASAPSGGRCRAPCGRTASRSRSAWRTTCSRLPARRPTRARIARRGRRRGPDFGPVLALVLTDCPPRPHLAVVRNQQVDGHRPMSRPPLEGDLPPNVRPVPAKVGLGPLSVRSRCRVHREPWGAGAGRAPWTEIVPIPSGSRYPPSSSDRKRRVLNSDILSTLRCRQVDSRSYRTGSTRQTPRSHDHTDRPQCRWNSLCS